MTRSAAGFTLVEVLVTLVVFAMLSLAGTALLGQSLTAKEQADDINAAIKDLQITHALMKSDFGQMVGRTARDSYGVREVGTGSAARPGAPVVKLVRDGWENPGGLTPRSSLQRVEYLIDEENLIRRVYPFVDGVAEADAYDQIILRGVSDIQVTYLFNGQWQAAWATAVQASSGLPEAVAIEFTSTAFGEIRQTFLTPGAPL